MEVYEKTEKNQMRPNYNYLVLFRLTKSTIITDIKISRSSRKKKINNTHLRFYLQNFDRIKTQWSYETQDKKLDQTQIPIGLTETKMD